MINIFCSDKIFASAENDQSGASAENAALACTLRISPVFTASA